MIIFDTTISIAIDYNQVIPLCLDLKKALEAEIKEEDVALEILVNDF